ncbi:MAG TPA: aminomethyl-transferring glycine dehydrogenase subunit GcvPA [Syntrophales bacterium]|nr:aminomethyl-transferring glycine dehydrogenase subunit GcvPA [Syntrophales bacterium]HOL59004.1 aminomethyl-transferring glycine dehydrogenase subunit GcvPA [Syntrophales bacterium]HPO34718.1 aminomethyl-transferring glycine dehydrogenase subunit GcvPA [Syntrophales bacterium]
MDYIPHTPEDIRHMLQTIGVESVDELFGDIPSGLRLMQPLNLPPPLTEQELACEIAAMSERNKVPYVCLMGAGSYNHYIPAVVRHIIGRSEFYTAYTPYQPEVSQGILQALYEYQTMILRLTGMEVTNASMYDGATALAEACLMALRAKGGSRIVVSRAIHPEYREVVKTYATANGYEVREAPIDPEGRTDARALEALMDREVAILAVQSPNFFGVLEDMAGLAEMAHQKGVLVCYVFTEALSLAFLQPPGCWGVDFVAGEGQSFGIPMSFGGPSLGILATTQAFLRRMPGRIVGATKDEKGERGYVLTLQAREQHIRREKATSNICSNETLLALAAVAYLSLLGRSLRELALLNFHRAHYLARRLSLLKGWQMTFASPFFNEFTIQAPDVRAVVERLSQEGILAGYVLNDDYPELKGGIVFCVTEMVSRRDLDEVVSILSRI